jgi:hypothetical protein
MDLWNELEQKRKELREAVRALATYGKRYALAESAYKVLLRKTALQLKADGMAVGLLNLVVYGDPEVAKARCERDIQEALYKADQELVNQIKLEMRILESQLNREWSVRE